MPSHFPLRYKEFLALLVQARKDAGMTQETLARLFSYYSQSDVSRIELGKRHLDVVETLAWLEALGVSPADFMRSLAERLESQRLGLGPNPGKAARKERATVVYRDGDNTWAGRGRKPLWVRAVEAKGLSIEQFRVPPRKKAK